MSIVKRVTHVLIVVLMLIVGATAAAVIVSQTAWFKNWLRGYIVREANQYLNGTLSIEGLGGNLFFGVEMENIGLAMDGSQVVAVKDLGLDYNVFELLTKGLSVDNIRLDKPVIYLRREGDTWSLSRLMKKQDTESDRSGPAKPFAVDAIGISDGSVVVESPVGTSGVEVPKRIDHLDAKLSFKYEPVRYSIEISHVSFRASEPALALNALSGGVAVKDDTIFVEKLALRTSQSTLTVDGAVQNYLTKPVLNLQVSSDKLSLPEIGLIVPAVAGIKLQPAFNIKTSGALDRLGVEMSVQSSAGNANGKLVADLVAPGQSVQGDVSVRHIDLSALLNDPKQKSDINADAHVDLHGEALANVNALRGGVTVDAPRLVAAGYVADRVHAKAQIDGRKVIVDGSASAYGIAATVAGNVTLPDFDKKARTVAFDLHGKGSHVDLRKLPPALKVPPAATDITAAYRAKGSVVPTTNVVADLEFAESKVGDARIAAGSTAGATINGADIAFRADASVSDLDLQQIGDQFRVPALANQRYKSRINGHVAASGRGTDPQSMDVTANGTLTDTSILGGTIPQLAFDASLSADTAHVKADGRFSGFDPAVASGKQELKGNVAGAINIDATVEHVSQGVTLEGVQADAKATLDASTIGGLELTRA